MTSTNTTKKREQNSEKTLRRKKTSALVGALVFLLLFGGMFCTVQRVLQLNMTHRGTYSVNGFYQEKKDTVDVVFIGASTMFCTADPLVLYEEYGITSYDFCSSSQALPLSYLFMEEAIERQHPKVVVLEVLSATNPFDDEGAKNLDYGLTDLPLSWNKIREVFGMFPGDPGKALTHLIPMVTYKDRWKELTKEDFTGCDTFYSKGAYTPDKIADSPLDFSYYTQDDVQEVTIPEENRRIFERMVNLCKENNTELLLLKSPNIGWTKGQSEAVKALAGELGIPFLNYFDQLDGLGLDFTNDFRDNSHLNRSGSQKVSKQLGNYLLAHYELADHRGEEAAASWERALAERAHDRKNESVSRAQNLQEMIERIKEMRDVMVAICISGDGVYMDTELEMLAQSFGLEAQQLKEGGSLCVQNGACISGMIHPGDASWMWESSEDTMMLTGYTITFDHTVYEDIDHGITILAYDTQWNKPVCIAGFRASDPLTPIYYVRQEDK